MRIIKAGSTELTATTALQIYADHKYVVNYSGVWQPHYSNAQNTVYFTKVINQKGIARRGRFFALSAKHINDILGETILA